MNNGFVINKDNEITDYTGSEAHIVIPDGIMSIKEDVFRGAFGGCNKLESIIIPDSVTYIGRNAFSDCEALSYVKLPANLEVIDALAFSGCSSLESIDIPYGTRSIKNSFGYCTALKSVVIPDSVTLLGDAFFGCTALEKVKLSNNITNLYASTFERTIWFEDSEDELLVSGGVLVKYNGNGGMVVLPKGIRVIGDGVFLDNDSIESIYIPDGVEYIGDSNFALCDNLKLVYIPSSVISVDGVTADTTRYWYLGGGDPPPF